MTRSMILKATWPGNTGFFSTFLKLDPICVQIAYNLYTDALILGP